MMEKLLIDENRLFAPVCMNQNAGYAFLDTGARYSTVLPRFAAGMARSGLRIAPIPSSEGAAEQVYVPELAFLGQVHQDLILDIHSDTSGSLDGLPFDVLLALGSDLLLERPLLLDLLAGKIGLASARESGVPMSFDTHLGVPFFKAALTSQPLNAIFDTGAGMCVLNQRWLSSLAGSISRGPDMEIEGGGGTRIAVPTFRCEQMGVGKAFLGSIRVLALDLSATEDALGVPVDFIFGVNAMKGQRWVLQRGGML